MNGPLFSSLFDSFLCTQQKESKSEEKRCSTGQRCIRNIYLTYLSLKHFYQYHLPNSSHFINFRWDDLGKLVTTGDIIRMTKGYVNVWKNCLTLYLAKISEFQKVNEFCMVFSELPFMRYVYLYYHLKVFYVMIVAYFSWGDFLVRPISLLPSIFQIFWSEKQRKSAYSYTSL
jgi:hypothetical protein